MTEGRSAPDAYGVVSSRHYQRVELTSKRNGSVITWEDAWVTAHESGVLQVGGELYVADDWTMILTVAVAPPR